MNLYRTWVLDEKHFQEHGTIVQRTYYVLAENLLSAIERTPRAGLEPIDWVSGELMPGHVFVGKLVTHDGR